MEREWRAPTRNGGGGFLEATIIFLGGIYVMMELYCLDIAV